MHTVVETPAFRRNAKKAGLKEAELNFIKNFLAYNPTIGSLIPGTGGARKVRFPARGKGKSGGYRVITFYSGTDVPLFILDIYSKGEKINLTQQEKNILKQLLAKLVDLYRSDDL